MNSSHISFDHMIEITNGYAITICAPIIFLNMICILFLSLLWSFYLTYQVMKEYRICKTFNYNKLMENSYTRLIKYIFFLVICLSECGISFSMIIQAIVYASEDNHSSKKSHHQLHPSHHGFHLDPQSAVAGLKFQIYYFMDSVLERIAMVSISTFFYLILTFARILTEFLCCKYDYFETKPYLSSKILRSFSFASVLVLIGLFRQLFLLSLICYSFALIYQFIPLFFAVRKLKRLLSKRLFDAQYLESQPRYVVNYFKRAYWNFKYASAILLIALFLQTLGYSAINIHSSIMMIVYLPHTWLSFTLYGTEVNFHQFPSADVYDHGITEIIIIAITLGTSLQVVPYILVSIRILFSTIRSKLGKIENKYDYTLVQKLITRNNNAYLRNHFNI